VLAIGASTGGPPALLQLFQALRGCDRQPILLTQHMPATFTTLLAEQLARAGGRPCTEARDGDPVEAGHCYVAPGGWHMTVERRGAGVFLRLDQEPPENFCRPAVDPMLRSAARAYGRGVLAVILTGMGSDGAKGCEAVARAGGRVIVQDEASSAVWGMPGAAMATGQVEHALPLQELGPWIRTALEGTR
jgi:two-component system chemotaxis response regulator CheB